MKTNVIYMKTIIVIYMKTIMLYENYKLFYMKTKCHAYENKCLFI